MKKKITYCISKEKAITMVCVHSTLVLEIRFTQEMKELFKSHIDCTLKIRASRRIKGKKEKIVH